MVGMARIGYGFGMSEALDPARLSALPADLRAAFEAQAFELDAERAARQHLEAENTDLKAANERLEHLVSEFRRARFGPQSEKLDEDQLNLAFEDIEVAIAETGEALDRRREARNDNKSEPGQRRSRALPKDLPRIESVIEPESIACPCGCGEMVGIGEDRTERLDITPAQFQVIVTIRPRYA